MAAYAIGITPLLKLLHEFICMNNYISKEVAFSDDFTVAGKISEIRKFWDMIIISVLKYGYFPKAEKYFLIVKENYIDVANDQFVDTNVKITTTAQRHLGAVIGSPNFKTEYVNHKILDLVKQLKLLSKIAEIDHSLLIALLLQDLKVN